LHKVGFDGDRYIDAAHKVLAAAAAAPHNGMAFFAQADA